MHAQLCWMRHCCSAGMTLAALSAPCGSSSADCSSRAVMREQLEVALLQRDVGGFAPCGSSSSRSQQHGSDAASSWSQRGCSVTLEALCASCGSSSGKLQLVGSDAGSSWRRRCCSSEGMTLAALCAPCGSISGRWQQQGSDARAADGAW